MANEVHWKQNLAPTTDENGKPVAAQSPNAQVLKGHAKAQAAPSQMRAAAAGGVDVKDRYDTLQSRNAEAAAIRNTKINHNSKRGEDTAQSNFLSSRIQASTIKQRADKVAGMSVEDYKAYQAKKTTTAAAPKKSAPKEKKKFGWVD